MPLGFGAIGTLTSSDPGGGRQFTRLKGALLLGQPVSIAGWPNSAVNPPTVINVSTMRADMLISINSSFAVSTGGVSNVTTSAPSGIVYLSMSTGTGNLIAAGSTANAPTGLPGGANGAGIVWDAAAKTLAIYDPGSSAWLWPHQLGSSGTGNTIVWSASSS